MLIIYAAFLPISLFIINQYYKQQQKNKPVLILSYHIEIIFLNVSCLLILLMLCIDIQKLSFMKLYLTIIAFVDFVSYLESPSTSSKLWTYTLTFSTSFMILYFTLSHVCLKNMSRSG